MSKVKVPAWWFPTASSPGGRDVMFRGRLVGTGPLPETVPPKAVILGVRVCFASWYLVVLSHTVPLAGTSFPYYRLNPDQGSEIMES